MVSNEEIRQALYEANELCRSFLVVAKRRGENTRWVAIEKQISKALTVQHELIHPDQISKLDVFRNRLSEVLEEDGVSCEYLPKYCSIFTCQKWESGKDSPTRPKLVNHDGFWECPKCQYSYGSVQDE